jgi:methionyl-tRNA synthetase
MEAMENEAVKQPAPAAATAAASAGTTSAAAAPQAAPEKIAIEDFAKVEMRVGQIKTAERIVGADKLLKLTVDIGTEIRQICAGIAQYYEPEALVGRKVAVVVNLAPRKLRGVESNGMIIAAAVGPEGRPVLAGFLEDVEVGARLK